MIQIRPASALSRRDFATVLIGAGAVPRPPAAAPRGLVWILVDEAQWRRLASAAATLGPRGQ